MSKTRKIVFIALFVALITVCSWIQIPSTIPFTLQTFAIFLALLCLGGKSGTIAIICYILLGLVGVPVFSGFKAGLSVIMQPTGGYIIGFVIMGLCYLIFERIDKPPIKIFSLVLGLTLLYLFGTLWFVFVATKSKEIGFLSALIMCVVPFIIPDLMKLSLAYFISLKLKKSFLHFSKNKSSV